MDGLSTVLGYPSNLQGIVYRARVNAAVNFCGRIYDTSGIADGANDEREGRDTLSTTIGMPAMQKPKLFSPCPWILEEGPG